MSWLGRRAGMLAEFRRQRPVDVTAFLGRCPFRPDAALDLAGLGTLADELNLSQLWVGHLASVFGFDTRYGNAQVLQAAADDSRLVPFAIVDPTRAGWRQELDWAVAGGAVGVRLTPGYHGYRLRNPAVIELAHAVREHRLLLQLCVRLQDDRVRHPRYEVSPPSLDEVAGLLRDVPAQLPVLLSGLRTAQWQEVRNDLGAGWSGVVGVDLWHVSMPVDAIAHLCREGLAGLFCFGSAAPIQEVEATAVQLGAADIELAQRKALCRSNAIGLLAAAGRDSAPTTIG